MARESDRRLKESLSLAHEKVQHTTHRAVRLSGIDTSLVF